MRTVITISSSFDYFLLKAKWSDEVVASHEDSGVCMLHGQRIPIQSNKPVQLQRRVSIHISFLILFVCELKATLSRSGSCSLFQKGYRGSLRPIRVVRWDLSHNTTLIWAGTAPTACRAHGGAEGWKEKPCYQVGSPWSSETAPPFLWAWASSHLCPLLPCSRPHGGAGWLCINCPGLGHSRETSSWCHCVMVRPLGLECSLVAPELCKSSISDSLSFHPGGGMQPLHFPVLGVALAPLPLLMLHAWRSAPSPRALPHRAN